MMAIRELKVCLLGDTGVGKSSIVCRFVQDHFDHNISPTIGASFMTKTVPCGNELHKFLIWDTAGQERFHSLAPMYYRGSAAAVIVYDITKQDSFHTLKKWVKELKEHGPENIVMAIAGNKCDLSDIREVPMKDAKEYAESIGAIVVETSAKNAINIEELFQGISRQIPPLETHENGNSGTIKLGKQTAQTTRRCC
ncbi:ras-related protein Rab-31 [Eublepharis macularius]|uniref:Ras-related protein Rab-31 n=1 Tax=Eublepharis macularius TaxID=481883 RepID=A0AA97L5L5_EUBMA|nr:ras-related protein Rab-31 isoform X3 [Sphaerodactylus townsendi]XP_053103580.1 ras-related protein Rab-31 [Hemicordylus capensis]XP_053103581.1 ras-related protein Rab-31 [Hemicordylus capensis]XP_053103582.1 ras-related protein Rab-31 [Hemicordylus capensis]XP_054840662.1 ras-related protein Rab-31 [Eublepharis macularius]